MSGWWTCLIAPLLWAGCVTPRADLMSSADADPNAPDAEIPVCLEDSLEIGRCEIVATGLPCTGAPEETVFVSIDDKPIPVVLGPQNANMFVLAVRTSGIDPGDVDNPASRDRPGVSISLFRDGAESMGRYLGRPTFVGTDVQDALDVFLIIDRSVRSGEVFTAIGELTDQNGEQRCGTLHFQVEN